MTAWLSKKPRLTPRGQYPLEIVRAIHTMQDDLSGNAKPEATTDEPLVAFQPHQAGGAAFYAAPEILESADAVPVDGVARFSPSPFLAEPPEALPVVENPAITPAPRDTQSLPQEPTVTELPVVTDENESLPSGSSFWEKVMPYRKWIILGLGIILILGALGLGWYWWHNQAKPTPPPVMNDGPVKSGIPPQMAIKVTEEKPDQVHYSSTQPNLLSFDTETVTSDAIKTELLKVALSIKQDNISQPVEFLVRDQNYNPLAFSRFSYLLGLNLDSDFLASLDETFSLFFYLDQDHPRIGLKISVKNQTTFVVSLKKVEGTFPKVFEPLFLDTTTAPKTGLTFHSGLYHEQAVRYTNIDKSMFLSIDHAVRGNEWFMGTSQNTLRAILDRDPMAIEKAAR